MGPQDEQHSQPSGRNRLIRVNLHTMKTALRHRLEGSFLFIFVSRLVNVKPVLALRAAKEVVWTLRLKDLIAALTMPQVMFNVIYFLEACFFSTFRYSGSLLRCAYSGRSAIS